jgi:hypothetical protein
MSTLHATPRLDRARPSAGPADPLCASRTVWWTVTAAVNALLIAWRPGAVDASLIVFTIAIAARHDGIVRGVFVLGRGLRSYRLHQLTYHLGQLHRAMAITGTAWFAVAIAAVGGALRLVVLILLIAMIWTARDAARHAGHNRFEAIHRYAGWTSVAILTALIAREPQPLAVALMLTVIALVVHPWLGVKRVRAEILAVTDQLAVIALPGRLTHGEFARVSRDGREWHSFAVATTGDDRACLVIRRAGDWTERLATDPPKHLFVRRMRGLGFMYHAQAYRRALIVATGAGIGPVLPYLLLPSGVEPHTLWIGRDHRAAVGDELVDRILARGDVELIDTAHGRPDVGALIAEHASRYEAVFVVSNAAVRDDVAAACERIGARWYGPTFDS